ncbi:ecdysoneless homolog [Hydra vulgaris]|uniref:Ecdysoneless homolog n=1 Tax=Hydra vulgaris TaxID=6087 RepID=F2XX02_HYDVU|nr:ecdysoneless homolog [Hydra vulgaris]ADU79236.1 SGT1 [Hydra vulgaris]
MSSDIIVEYRIFHLNDDVLKIVRNYYDDLINSVAKEYIWQKESFRLSSVEEYSGLACLSGSTCVGENINDEWFIVYLLFEISKHHKDVIIQVNDNDGDFLLIEAADFLPPWLTPANSENRVFIKDGKVHFIPIPSNPAEIMVYFHSTPTLKQAYHLLTSSLKTVGNENVQCAIQKRISCYPSKFMQEFHHALCYIPVEIVYILQKKPKLVSSAVQAFYERDSSDIKTCRSMSSFKPESRTLVLVRFTRHLYCQLMQAHFVPEQHSLWKLPAVSNSLRKPAELGFKLTCGFQILLSRLNAADSKDNTNKAPSLSEPSGKMWEQYLLNLNNSNYFKNELEGSVKYKDLMNKAKLHFQDHVANSYKSDAIGLLIQDLIHESGQHISDIKPACENVGLEDDDSWMTLTEEELDNMMLNMWGKNHPDTKKHTENLNTLVTNMKSFVEQVSSYEGAEPLNNDYKGAEPLNSDLKQNDKDKVLDPIHFEPDIFMKTIKNLLDSSSDTNKQDMSDDDEENDSDSDLDSEMVEVMQQMDNELRTTNIPKSFDCKEEKFGLNEEIMNIDINLVKNFLESFSSQEGLSGPVSNILQSIGMSLPPNDYEM